MARCSPASIAPYVEAAKRVAKAEACELVDLPDAFTAHPSPALGASGGLGDGLHFDTKGNAEVYRLVRSALERCGLGPKEMTRHLPHFLHLAAPQMFDKDGNLMRGKQ